MAKNKDIVVNLAFNRLPFSIFYSLLKTYLYFYNLEEYRHPQLKMIESNQLVKITSTIHSSDFRENPPAQKLVYVNLIIVAIPQIDVPNPLFRHYSVLNT